MLSNFGGSGNFGVRRLHGCVEWAHFGKVKGSSEKLIQCFETMFASPYSNYA